MQAINLDDALKAFGETIKRGQYQEVRVRIDLETGLHMITKIGKMYKPKFVIDEYNREAYEQLFWYFTGQFENFHGDPDKGNLLIGQKGTGKTMAMVVMRSFIEFLDVSGQFANAPFKPTFQIVKTTEIKSNFADQENGGLKTLRQYKTRHQIYCFDDIGEEINNQPLAIHYSIQLNVIENILTTRAEHFKIHHTKTHATSNYPIASSDGSERYFQKFYGDRIEDRSKEMFNTIFFQGESRRK